MHCAPRTYVGTRGGALRKVIEGSDDPSLAALLLRLVRVSSGNVVGTPGSMRSFRSKLLSGTYAFGAFTAFPTYNPSELQSPAVMQMGGSPFGFDENGWPDSSRPNSERRYRVVAGRPAACATFFRANIDAVQLVAYGWRAGAQRQETSDCLFGQVLCRACWWWSGRTYVYTTT